jgi:tetratricopeptide (TPR) repeat protein
MQEGAATTEPTVDSAHMALLAAANLADAARTDAPVVVNPNKVRKVMPQTIEDKVGEAMRLKAEGSEKVKEQNYKKAKVLYSKALAYLWEPDEACAQYKNSSNYTEPSEELKAEMATQRIALHSNISLCLIKMGDYARAADECQKVLAVEPNNTKALFRVGQAYMLKGDLDKAKAMLQAAKATAPDDKGINNELVKLARKFKEHAAKEKKKFAGMFE